MIDKSMLARSPVLKSRESRSPNQAVSVPITDLPAEAVNMVLELVHPDSRRLEDRADFAVPNGAIQRRLSISRGLEIIVTVLGHGSNLLIKPVQDGFAVAHLNERFSTNRKGVTYTAEVYSQE